MIKARKKELGRIKECLIDYFYGDNEYKSSDQLWLDYFHFFELLASREREKAIQERLMLKNYNQGKTT